MAKKFDPIPDDFMNVVFGDVYKKLTNGGDPAMLGPNNFVAWEPVASVIDEEAFDFASKGAVGVPPKIEGMTEERYAELRTEKKFSSFAYAAEFARIADQIPANIPEMLPDGKGRAFTVFNPNSDSVSDVYRDTLEFCVVKDSKIDPNVEKKIERERSKLFKTKKLKNPDFDEEMVEDQEDNPKFLYQSFISPAYAKYLEYEALYNQEEEALSELQMRVDEGDVDAMAELAASGKSLKRKKESALKRWEALGYKGHIEKVMNYIDEVESSNFISVKKRYESEFATSERTDIRDSSAYHYAAPIPAKILENNRGWTKFIFTKSDYESSKRSTSHQWSAKAGYFGIGKVNAEGKHTKDTADFNFNDFHMSFRLTKCYVSRPWLGMSFLKSRFWKYSKTGKDIMNNELISDGNGKGKLPAVVTELYLLSELNIGFRKGSDSYKKVENIVKGGGGVRLGLFNIGGSYSYADEKIDSSRKREAQGVNSDAILLVGRKCTILDMAPNPLPSIKDDEWVEVK